MLLPDKCYDKKWLSCRGLPVIGLPYAANQQQQQQKKLSWVHSKNAQNLVFEPSVFEFAGWLLVWPIHGLNISDKSRWYKASNTD